MIMKTEKFVSPELAIELQKFNYNTDEYFGYFVKQLDETYSLNLYQEELEGYTDERLRIDAPLISEVMDWLLEVYNIHIEFNFDDNTWFAYIGKLTVPDFSPDITISIEVEEEYFSNIIKVYRDIKISAIKEALKFINK